MTREHEERNARGWMKTAVQLWALLDDIDTADDVAKGDDAAYRRICQRIQQRRFQILNGEDWDKYRAVTSVEATACEQLILDGRK